MNATGKMVNAQFSATSVTLFNDSHLPLAKWFMAMAMIVDAKRDISATQLQQHLGIAYWTAWYMALASVTGTPGRRGGLGSDEEPEFRL